MPFQVYENKKTFDCRIKEIKEISHASNLYLNTSLKKSKKQDGALISWLKWIVCLIIPKLHIAQTAPLKVAQEICTFAEKHQKFLGEKDQLALIEAVENLKFKCHKYAKGKEKNLDEVIDKIKNLTTTKFHDIDDLPVETLEWVLSKLGKEDYENCLTVDRRWNETILEAAKKKEASLIKNFIQFAIDHYKAVKDTLIYEENAPWKNEAAYLEMRLLTHLENIKNNLNFSKAATLPQLKIAIFGEKLKILMAMQSYHPQALKSLREQGKNLKLPWLFDDIFIPGINTGDNILEGIEKLLEKGVFDVKIINENTSEYFKGHTIRTLAHKFVITNQSEKAIEIANTISDRSLKHLALEDIFKALAQNSCFEEALEMANNLCSERDKGKNLAHLSTAIAKSGRFEEALKIANDIQEESCKAGALIDISKELAHAGRAKEALEIIDKISEDHLRPHFESKAQARAEISKLTTQASHVKKALKTTSPLTEGSRKNNTFPSIAAAFAHFERYEKALKIANTAPRGSLRDKAHATISSTLALQGELKRATNIANLIIDKKIKNEALADISRISTASKATRRPN
ncbi:hypothetical protein [Parachlamydia sp. AcF125]|uniref:hypothetical protein n=1 Tax=Parachlamydia sp. AcF125 TaxID=2795736 RepID=UPI001BC97BB3|nr:hypothetical protein [Parachlamydia sp. AcF125]MBS4168090.1 hypothetical protein [Parachlamydia sp. AcF125]